MARPSSIYRSVKLKPDYAEAHNNLGSLLRQQGAIGRRSSPVRDCRAIHYADARNNLGMALRDAGRCMTQSCSFNVRFAEPDDGCGARTWPQVFARRAYAKQARIIESAPAQSGDTGPAGYEAVAHSVPAESYLALQHASS